MISHCIKFEVSRFTCYEAMNDGAKSRKWGALKVMGHSIERIFDSQSMRLSCIVFEIVSNFDPPHLHLVPPSRILRIFLASESMGHCVVFVCVILRLVVLV